MTMMCLSLSHRFVPAEALEKLAVPAAELGAVLARLRALPGVDEAVVLSTCNRVEVYAAVSGPAGPVAAAVAGLLAARGDLQADEVTRMARNLPGGAAAEHLFSVACGLDSMAVGEDQIVAQVKAAARAAAAARTAGPAVTGLIDAALAASKRARTPDHDQHGRHLAGPGRPGPRRRAAGRARRARRGRARDGQHRQARGPAAPPGRRRPAVRGQPH